MTKIVGLLALQGDFAAHRRIMERCNLNIKVREVRDKSTFEECDALVIPGGESTTMSCLCDRYDLWNPIRQRIQNGMPIFGTCAGLIMLAHEISGASNNMQQKTLDVLDISVARNAYGRQIDSFEADLPAPLIGDEPLHAVFIRAPQISRVGEKVQTIATFRDQPVAVQSGKIVGATFHPEMSDDIRLHQYWLELFA